MYVGPCGPFYLSRRHLHMFLGSWAYKHTGIILDSLFCTGRLYYWDRWK